MFQGSGGEIHSRVAQEMRAVLHDNDDPTYLDENGKTLLRASRRIAKTAGILASDILLRTHSVQWFPWVGTRALRTLALHAQAAGIPHEMDRLSISYKIETPQRLFEHLRTVIEGCRNGVELAALLPVKTFEKFDGLLSDELLDAGNAHDHLDMETARKAALLVVSSAQSDR